MNQNVKQIQKHFGSTAQNWSTLYDQPASRSIYIHNLQRRKQIVLELLKDIRGRVLEIGCGSGNVILSLPENLELNIFGADFSTSMLRKAKENGNGGKNTLSLLAANALHLPFKNEVFSTLLCLGVLEYIPNYKRVISECYRILEPGGQFILSVPNIASPFIQIDDFCFKIKNAVTLSMPKGVRSGIKTKLLGKQEKSCIRFQSRRFNPLDFTDCFRNLGFNIDETCYHTFGFGLLNGARFNVRLSERLESRAHKNATLEKLGWTYILKAKKD